MPQPTQADSAVRSFNALYLPLGQPMQLACPSWPWYVPSGQLIAYVAEFLSTNLPGGALEHISAPVVGEKNPIGHILEELAAVPATYSPGMAITQLVFPMTDWYCPELQSVHLCVPYLPTGQAVFWVSSLQSHPSIQPGHFQNFVPGCFVSPLYSNGSAGQAGHSQADTKQS